MAQSELVITFNWENKDSIIMKANLNDAGTKTILEMEENGCLSKLWDGVKHTIMTYLEIEVDKMGNDMKA